MFLPDRLNQRIAEAIKHQSMPSAKRLTPRLPFGVRAAKWLKSRCTATATALSSFPIAANVAAARQPERCNSG
jgi:hypothetical protein